MKKIPLTQGKFTLVDDEDFEWLNQWKWHIGGTDSRYAVRVVRINNGRKRVLFMHRVILSVPSGICTDHIDGDGYNNQRYNLRLATRRQNSLNRGPSRNNLSGLKGVKWDSKWNKWVAKIRVAYKLKYIGAFSDKYEAARAYDKAALEYFGEFAWLNFPDK